MVKFFNSLVLVVAISLVSCNSTKNIVYFENVKDTVFYSSGTTNESILQPNNILSITISSANKDASAEFNQNN